MDDPIRMENLGALRDEEIISRVWPNLQVAQKLGAGSFGSVYRTVNLNPTIKQYSAVKIVRFPQSAEEAEATAQALGLDSEEKLREYYAPTLQKVLDEVRLMDELKTSGAVVTIQDFACVETKEPFGWIILIRMELLQSLGDYRKEHDFTEADMLRIAADMCRALQICHQRNIIHRDVKESNIFRSEHGTYKLGDFGISRHMESNAAELSHKGTGSYMAPEIVRGEAYDYSVDIYALGIVLYRLLNNNRLPFLPAEGKLTLNTVEEANAKRLSGAELPDPIHADAELGAIIRKACAYEAKDRYDSADELREALEVYSIRKKRRQSGVSLSDDELQDDRTVAPSAEEQLRMASLPRAAGLPDDLDLTYELTSQETAAPAAAPHAPAAPVSPAAPSAPQTPAKPYAPPQAAASAPAAPASPYTPAQAAAAPAAPAAQSVSPQAPARPYAQAPASPYGQAPANPYTPAAPAAAPPPAPMQTSYSAPAFNINRSSARGQSGAEHMSNAQAQKDSSKKRFLLIVLGILGVLVLAVLMTWIVGKISDARLSRSTDRRSAKAAEDVFEEPEESAAAVRRGKDRDETSAEEAFEVEESRPEGEGRRPASADEAAAGGEPRNIFDEEGPGVTIEKDGQVWYRYDGEYDSDGVFADGTLLMYNTVSKIFELSEGRHAGRDLVKGTLCGASFKQNGEMYLYARKGRFALPGENGDDYDEYICASDDPSDSWEHLHVAFDEKEGLNLATILEETTSAPDFWFDPRGSLIP